MLNKLYNKIVTTNENVDVAYTFFKKKHPNLHANFRLISWCYLFGLNFKFRVLKREPNLTYPESNYLPQPNYEKIKKMIDNADIVSFDVFDTLILRNVSNPTDVFSILAAKTGMVNYCDMRIKAEESARFVARKNTDSSEVTIFDIYDCCPIFPYDQRQIYLDLEFEVEKSLCYANPYIKQSYDYAVASGKPVIIMSDMYWTKPYMKGLLESCGYKKFDNIFISGECKKGKYTGELQRYVSNMYPGKKILHIGDDIVSDISKTKNGRNFKTVHYFKTELAGFQYRPNLKSTAGSIYKSLVNSYLHNGVKSENPYVEFGYVYGGFLSYGYCQFIDRIAKEKENTKILFIARDSLTFYEIYNKYFGDCPSEYFYASRESLLKAALPYSPDVFFDIMFAAKTRLKQKISIVEALQNAGLGFLQQYLSQYDLTENDLLSGETVDKLQELFYFHLNEVINSYKEYAFAACEYVKQAVFGYSNVIIVDLGWRGTICSLLKYIINSVYPDCNVCGTVIGSISSTISTALMDSALLKSYCFSQEHNTDLIIKGEHIMVVETIFSSEQPGTVGYAMKEGKATPLFGEKENGNTMVFSDLKKGMYKFCEDYNRVEKSLGINFTIQGKEAYLPLKKVIINKKYIISLFGALNSTDLSACRPYNLKMLLKRYGYY